MDSEPVAGEPAQIVFRPAGRGGPGVALAAGIPLLLVGVAATVAGLWWAVVVVVLAAWFVLTARQRAVLTDHELTVQGRFTRRSVMLARITAVAEDRSRTAWVAADDQAPFRVYFVPGGDPGPSTPGTDLFVTEVRRRARAAGAAVDLGADRTAAVPAGASVLFSL